MLELSAPQNIFLNGLNTKFRGYVGGFGSGKTFVGCLDLLIFMLENPGTVQGYFGPSYPSIRDIFYPTFEECAEMLGFRVKINVGNREVHVYKGSIYYGTIICRSMDNPNSIVGFKIARALVDEIDILPTKKAANAWKKIIARLRLGIKGVQNSIGVTTTPEGFKFVYQQFADEPTKSYSMVQASTYENEEYLPDDYIDSLLETYPDNLVSAYIKGLFVNLTTGSVYTQFDRELNHSDRTLEENEPIHIGMDFNVNNMNALVHVETPDPVAVDEITGVLDTPEIIEVIEDRYCRGGRSINIYPDASGSNRSSNRASETDIHLLESAGFQVHVNAANPFVKDRINSVQSAFCNSKGERKYKINTTKCPKATANYEQQVYTEGGEPDKSQGQDHMPDAGGYYISYKWPIIKPISNLKVKFAL